MPGLWKRPVGGGLGVCHDPRKWSAHIPRLHTKGEWLEVVDKASNESRVAICVPGTDGEEVTTWVEKAHLCDLAWAILKQFEVPHIQEELVKLERKANY